jgi:DMSO/TMAO reductase YedYZ molybdopterin-dependent catalytic subunit
MSFFMDRSKDQADPVPGTTGLDAAIIVSPPPIDLDRAEDKAGFWESNRDHMRGDPWAEERQGW